VRVRVRVRVNVLVRVHVHVRAPPLPPPAVLEGALSAARERSRDCALEGSRKKRRRCGPPWTPARTCRAGGARVGRAARAHATARVPQGKGAKRLTIPNFEFAHPS